MKEKQKFSINVSGLNDYTNELNPEMIQEKFFEKKSLGLFNKMKVDSIGTQALNILDNTIYWQDTACSLIESGSTTLTQRDLSIEAKTVRLDWCKSSFYQKWTNYFMNSKMSSDGGTIEAQITDAILSEVADQYEIAIWQAVDGGSNHYDSFDGLLEVLSGSSCVDDTWTTYGTSGTTNLSYSNIDDVVDDMIENIPDAIVMDPNLRLFLSPSNFLTLARKYNDTYKGFQERKYDANFTMKHPVVPNLTIEGVRGLSNNTNNSMIITTPENIVVPVTTKDQYVSMEYSYDPDSRSHIIFIDFIVGVQVARPEYVVTNFLTA